MENEEKWMKTKSGNWLAIPVLAILASLVVGDSLNAFTGSWGSRGVAMSRGSWGSGLGSNGGFRTPVRNFLAGVFAPRAWGSGGSVGGCIGGRCLGSYGSVGSQTTWGSGGGFGSSGGYASVGGSFGSVGSSYVSTVPTDGYSTMYDATYSSAVGYPINGTAQLDCVNCGSGLAPSGIMPSGEFVVPSDAGMIQPGSVVPGSPYYEPAPVEGSTPPVPSPVDGSKDEFQPPTPQPEGETTTIRNQKPDEAVLNLSLPLDAKVYINGKLTKTTGSFRSFVSRRLRAGGKYAYDIKAVAKRNGQDVVLERKIELLAGMDQSIELDFDAPQLTQLSVRVPTDAKVTLAGNETIATGELRHYKTKLMPGEKWNDYKVVVTIQQDGRTIVSEKKLDIVAGQSYALDFRSDISKELIASK
jgi:uncharacterized protein (TIGR03000 family)